MFYSGGQTKGEWECTWICGPLVWYQTLILRRCGVGERKSKLCKSDVKIVVLYLWYIGKLHGASAIPPAKWESFKGCVQVWIWLSLYYSF